MSFSLPLKINSDVLATYSDEEFKLNADSRVGAEDIEDYYFASTNALKSNHDLISYLTSSSGTAGGALSIGRILLVTSRNRKELQYVRAPSIVVRSPVKSATKNSAAESTIVCMILLPEGFTSNEGSKLNNLNLGDLNFVGRSCDRNFAVVDVRLDEIFAVTNNVKVKIDSKAFFREGTNKIPSISSSSLNNPFEGAKLMKTRQDDDIFAGMTSTRGKKASSNQPTTTPGSQETQLIEEVMVHLIKAEASEKNVGLELLDLKDCAKNMHHGSSEVEFRQAVDRLVHQIATVRHLPSHAHPNLEKHYATVDRKETLRSRVMTLRHLLSNESLQLFPDFLQRKALLMELGYIDEGDTVCLKGRVACEVNTCESLIVTEMIFEGMLNELEPTEIVALLSALLFQEKSDEDLDSELPQRLVTSCDRMRGIAVHLGEKQKACGLPVDPLEFAATSLKMGLVHVVYEWACGVPFSSICELTDVQEGSIVRCITRLDELCREVRNCSRVVGNPTLYRKMEVASEAIKRDIVFASSLYVA